HSNTTACRGIRRSRKRNGLARYVSTRPRATWIIETSSHPIPRGVEGCPSVPRLPRSRQSRRSLLTRCYRSRRNIQSARRNLGHEKIPEHARAHNANAVVLFQIEQVCISRNHEPCSAFNRCYKVFVIVRIF